MSRTRHHADLFFHLPDTPADAIHQALLPEADAAEVPRTRATLHREPGGIRIHLHADELSSLRAAVNSYLRWIDAAEKAAALARD